MGLPLLILPGLMCDDRMFAPTLAGLPNAQVIGGWYGAATSLAAMAEHALALAPPRFELLGHSMGARIALEVLRLAPGRVGRLILADTGIHPAAPGEREKRYALRDLGHAQGFAALVDHWLPPMLAAHRRGDPAITAPLRAMCLAAGQATFERQTEALLARPPLGALLATIACPTLSITGALDSWSPPAQHEAIAAAIPGAALAIVPGAGHMLPFEDPAAFNAEVARFLGAN